MAAKKKGDQAQRKSSKRSASLTHKLIKGMSHPLRVLILSLMNERPWSPREIATELDEGLSHVSYHVKVLFDHELIELVKTKPRRGAIEHYYSAIERAFITSNMTKYIPQSAQRILGDDTLRSLDADLRASLESGKFYERSDWHASWTPVDLDDQGCKDAERLADRFVEDMLEIEAQSTQRRAECEDGGEHIATTAAALVFSSEKGEKQKTRSPKPATKKKSKSAKGTRQGKSRK